MTTTIIGRDTPRRRWTERVIVLCLCVAASAAYAVHAGQDRNWDQRNYHIYSVYAWLNGKTFTELAPAQIQSWLNPAPHVVQYLLVRHLPPVAAGAVMGGLAGINGLLLWVLVRRLQGEMSGWRAKARAAVALTMGLSGSIYLSFLGTTFAEYLCSPFVLASLVCLTTPAGSAIGVRGFLLAGLWLGAVCGLKLTNLVYALGMSAALVVMWPFFRFRLAEMSAYAVGGIVGFVLVGGYWATRLWLAFSNPLFPFYNAFFGSPWFALVNFADRRFLPRSYFKALVTYPFGWLVGLHPTSELPFREPRFALVAVVLPLAVAVMLVRAVRRAERGAGASADTRNFWLCVLFFVCSFAIWLKQFGIQRYVLPLELLSGVVVLSSLERLVRNVPATIAVFAGLTLFAVAWTRPPDWEHMAYGAEWFGIGATEPSPPPILYVMLGGTPMGYAIPFLPKEDQFVRLSGNMRLEPGSAFGQRALAMIRQHQGPLRTMTISPIAEGERARLARFGLQLAPDSCRTAFQSRIDQFLICELSIAPTPRGTP